MSKPQKREMALQKFLSKRENKKEVIGALVCGSYVTGNPSKHSDIDLHIILHKDTKRRERWNEIVDGFLIEYFANPVSSLTKYFESDYKANKKITIHMVATGRILFDKTWELAKAVALAKKYVNKPMPKPGNTMIEVNKYMLRDTLDNLNEIYHKKGDEFHLAYYDLLYKLSETYSKFLQLEVPKAHKVKRFLTDKDDMKKYNFPNFPDKAFVKQFTSALKLHDHHSMMKKIKKLTHHVLDKMWGFDVDGRKLRTPAI